MNGLKTKRSETMGAGPTGLMAAGELARHAGSSVLVVGGVWPTATQEQNMVAPDVRDAGPEGRGTRHRRRESGGQV